jgi:HEAT repeat protein
MRWLVLAAIGLFAAGCEPNYIETSAEVDIYLSQARYKSACVALKNDREHSLREYTARLLAKHPDQPDANACICKALTSWRHGPYDDSVLAGISGTKRDDFVACALPAFDKAEGEDRVKLVVQLGDLGAPAGYAKLVALVAADSEAPEVRAAAIRGLLPVRADHAELLLGRLTAEPQPSVRAAIAEVFENATEPAVVQALVQSARNDPDGEVRAAALKAVVKLRIPETDAMVCDAMMNDPDERVRDRAVRSFKGTKRDEALDCLERRLKTREDSALVRESTLTAIYSSPSDRAARILCDNIGPFLRMYVGDLPVTKMDGADIVKYQNNRDHERSFECVQRANAQGGLSCYGKYYLAVWINDLGGKAFKPTCKGMEANIIEAD